ncbi:MAG: CPBP family intramembrane metalloprotease [Anaerolineae bacterium]|nr:CPBP family intramembrane metalloprotease [Gemmatimonadaceae bacterium]
MTLQRLIHSADGTLLAPLRIGGFLLVTVAAVAILGGLADALHLTSPAMGPLLSSWIVLIALVVAHVVMLRVVEKRDWSSMGLGRNDARAMPLIIGAFLGALAIGVPSVILLTAGWLRPMEAAGSAAGWWGFAAWMALFLAPAALWEELAFRGYIFDVLRRALGAPAALGSTSILFGVIHWNNPGAGLRPLVLVSLAGVFLGAVVLATQSVYAAWTAHFAWNWVMAALLHSDVSGFLPSTPPGYRVMDSGPDWLTGGTWGPEGGAAAGVGMAAGLGFLYVRSKRRARAGELPS